MALSRSTSKLGDGSTVVAIDRDKNISLPLVKWAADNLFRVHKKSPCVILHVLNHSTHSHSHSTVSKGSNRSTEEELQEIILPCLGYCARKGITAKEVLLHDIDVPSAIIDYIIKNDISNVVVGASNRNAILRKFKAADVPTSLIKSAPNFCSVYVISKGKPQTVRAATQALKPKNDVPPSYRSAPNLGSAESGSSSKLSATNVSSFMSMPSTNHSRSSSTSNSSSPPTSSSLQGNPQSDFSGFSGLNSFQSATYNTLDSFTSLEISGNTFIVQTPEDLEAEMSTLNVQLKQTMDIYNSVCNEATEAKERVNELHLKPAKERSLEEATAAEEAATAFAELEKQKTKLATEAAHIAERIAEIETQKRKFAEMRAGGQEAEQIGAVRGGVKYRRYTIQEIQSATDYFNNKQKIGEGGYGPVYKGFLDHTPVAIKILRPDISQGLVQFQQEVEVLSCIRHPNMVLLVGACPEYGCLVYEYMDNGSLEDRLFCKDNTSPLSWRTRFKIAAEIATSLLFLHERKPEPLVHRDLKPANILLDRNFVSKISDVGLARLVPASAANSVTQYHMTAAAGTFCYIDPEYQQTGLLGVKSDVYSLGVMLLQIITSKPPIGLSYQVEEAIEQGTFAEILDPTVLDWPVEEALCFAKLALQCCEMRKRDRPDLGSVVLPELNRLTNLGMVEDYGK
ncbi:U-box domain-containing protein 51 [Morus notabilis]|uniref:U-box domain-containing protein 51 n=1 Tax=Morus notabilis TaxID=981085 RepID=W9QZE0_9ROSA|nr:U-box domain-containing protein 51 [Morus notabilis]EXB29692.1 U-box domain-containing protein 51 [Morus notabilis]